MSDLRSKIRSLQGEVSPVFGKPWSLLAAVALIGLWHGLALARESSLAAFTAATQHPVIQLPKGTDMATFTTSWRSGGLPQTVTVTQTSEQTVAEALAAYTEAVRLAKIEFPPDPE